MSHWFEEARYGLFMHWGLYSLLGGVWKGMETPWVSEWIMRKMRIPISEYGALASRFEAKGFDAEQWARDARDAGMKYIVITSKHHDGFAMFHSKYDRYNIVDATPFGRDPMKELAQACKKYGLRLGFYYSQDQDWHEKGASGNDWDFKKEEKTPEAFQQYLDTKVKTQLRELLTNYGDIAIIWFDTPCTISAEQSQELTDLVHSLQPNCLVSGRIGNDKGDYISLGDNAAPYSFPDRLCEGLGTMNDSWGYKSIDVNYRSDLTIIRTLGLMAARSTNYLLNVGPDGNGRFPEQARSILRATGAFLQKYGFALYGTHGVKRNLPYVPYWGDLTAKGNKLYMWIIEKKEQPIWFYGIRNHALKATVDGMEVQFTEQHNADYDYHKLAIELPAGQPLPCIVTVELDGEPDCNERAYSAGASGLY